MRIHSEYLHVALDRKARKDLIDEAEEALTPIAHTFEAIAFTGVSGALLAPSIADRLNKHLIVVRKTAEDCHSACDVEGAVVTGSYLIVDDMISSEATVHTIIKAIKRAVAKEEFPLLKPMPVGVYLYRFSNLEDCSSGGKNPVTIPVYTYNSFRDQQSEAACH